MSATPRAPKIGFVSLGCPKALVDSERIITKLRAEGYELSPSYDGADAVVVNTCGFLNSAKEESLEAIGEALAENDKITVPNFGTFQISERPARAGRNPATGEAITIAASRSVRFKVSKNLKAML